MAHDPTELKRIFSWLGLAPALANVVGPVLAGTLIDLAGFQLAFAALAALPLASLVWARFVPVEARAAAGTSLRRPNSWNLLREPGFARLLLVNWLLSSSWDVHSFLVPILGHERGFSASAIGLVLGVFATAVAVVRLAIPMLAHRLRESHVLVGAMLLCAAVFALYPLAHTAWVMGCFAVVLGLALGAVQPMIMTTLHQITPAARHGEAIALRSMAINLSSAVMPLAFGVAGATLGASALFWMMGAAVASGSVAARHVGATVRPSYALAPDQKRMPPAPAGAVGARGALRRRRRRSVRGCRAGRGGARSRDDRRRGPILIVRGQMRFARIAGRVEILTPRLRARTPAGPGCRRSASAPRARRRSSRAHRRPRCSPPAAR